MVGGAGIRRRVLGFVATMRDDPGGAVAEVERLTLVEAAVYLLVMADWLLAEVNSRYDQWVAEREGEL